MVTRRLPYDECSNPAQIYRRVSQGVLPEAFSCIANPTVRDFVAFCISLRSDGTRPSVFEVSEHPFLTTDDEADDDDDLILPAAEVAPQQLVPGTVQPDAHAQPFNAGQGP